MDAVTALVALAAVLVVVDRFVHPLFGAREPDPRHVERSMLGTRPPALRLTDAATHRAQEVGFRGPSRQLVLLFRTTCPACEATRPQWDRIVAGLPAGVPVHAISKESVDRPYFAAGSRVRVWQPVSPSAFRLAFPSPFVPTTVVLSPDGRVVYAHVGVLEAAAADSVAAMLGGRVAASAAP
jgi:hypothetical protein